MRNQVLETNKALSKEEVAERIWTAAFLRSLKKMTPKKAAKKADDAVIMFEQRWSD